MSSVEPPSVSTLMRSVISFSLSLLPLQLPEAHVGPLSTQVAFAAKQLPESGTKFPHSVKYCVPSAVASALSNVCEESSGIAIAVLSQPPSDNPVAGDCGLLNRSRAASPSVRSTLVRKSQA